jgi:hypothetical protein
VALALLAERAPRVGVPQGHPVQREPKHARIRPSTGDLAVTATVAGLAARIQEHRTAQQTEQQRLQAAEQDIVAALTVEQATRDRAVEARRLVHEHGAAIDELLSQWRDLIPEQRP